MISSDKFFCAVLTGDVIGSSKMPPSELKASMQRLRDGAQRFADTYPRSVYGKLDVYSGDGWQVLMPDWLRSLRAALFFRALVKSYPRNRTDTRIAIAWGEVDKKGVNIERVSESTGEAFTLSGRALQGLKKNRCFTWEPGTSVAPAFILKSVASLLDELAHHWTARQAEILALALLGYQQEKIANAIGRTQPTVHQALQATGWRGIEEFLMEIEIGLKTYNDSL